MENIALLFFLSVFLVFFAYFGYPLTLLMLRTGIQKPLKGTKITPPVTLIITAFNEEKRIREKLDNTLKLDYPRENLQIIVASDGSTDNTNAIVLSYRNRGVELLEVSNRGGKENAQKEAVAVAEGEIIVFSDVATILEPQGLQEIVAGFSDPSVGCISSEDRLLDRDGRPGGEGFYVRYEMWLRRLESEVNSLVGLSGSFFAARKVVCRHFSANVQSDFRTLLNSMQLGLRGVTAPAAKGYYRDISDERREFDRKIRTVLRGITVFGGSLEFLNPFRYGLFAYQFFCHKLLRWLVPFFLITALLANAILATGSLFYSLLLVCQLLFYAIGLYGWKTGSLSGILKIPMFFLVVNAAILTAWIKYIQGERIVFWAPSKR